MATGSLRRFGGPHKPGPGGRQKGLRQVFGKLAPPTRLQVGYQRERLGEIVPLVGMGKVQLREQLAGKLLDAGVAFGEEGQVGMAAGL